ncbi:hypothetical protein JHK87_027202 [Glycine soja]|nr:hypothetical protein JHK87_027202 [Glycine soja]
MRVVLLLSLGGGGEFGDVVNENEVGVQVNDFEDAGGKEVGEKKGHLLGASLNDKIFVGGDGNGVDCFSDVEMLDLDIRWWIPTRSMLDKRFSFAAVQLNGAIYATSGFDGNDYLRYALGGFDGFFLNLSSDFKIQNIVGSCDVKFPIWMKGLAYSQGATFSSIKPHFPSRMEKQYTPPSKRDFHRGDIWYAQRFSNRI